MRRSSGPARTKRRRPDALHAAAERAELRRERLGRAPLVDRVLTDGRRRSPPQRPVRVGREPRLLLLDIGAEAIEIGGRSVQRSPRARTTRRSRTAPSDSAERARGGRSRPTSRTRPRPHRRGRPRRAGAPRRSCGRRRPSPSSDRRARRADLPLWRPRRHSTAPCRPACRRAAAMAAPRPRATSRGSRRRRRCSR